MFILSLSIHDILTWIAIVLCFTVITLMSRFFRVLRKRHKATWMTLGEPTAVYNFSAAIQWKVNRFLWRRDYKQLADPMLDRLGVAIKILMVAIVLTLLLVGAFWTEGE